MLGLENLNSKSSSSNLAVSMWEFKSHVSTQSNVSGKLEEARKQTESWSDPDFYMKFLNGK